MWQFLLHESACPLLRGLNFLSSQGLIWLSSGESFSLLAAISSMTYNCNGINVFDLFLNNIFNKIMATLSNVDLISPDQFACTVYSAPVKSAYSWCIVTYLIMWFLHSDLLRTREVSSQALILLHVHWLSTQHIQEESSQGNQGDPQVCSESHGN
jgi:hypothetical protein